MSWFHRRHAERSLIGAIIEGEIERRKIDAELRAKDREISLREREMELANLERIGDEKRKDMADRQRLRELRREWAAKARANRAEKRAYAGQSDCPACRNPADPFLSAAIIEWHHAGHPQA